MSGYLFNGEPSWSGDIAPRRPRLHARHTEWSDAIEDGALELSFAWLAMPCGLKERALLHGALAAAEADRRGRDVEVVQREIREYLAHRQDA